MLGILLGEAAVSVWSHRGVVLAGELLPCRGRLPKLCSHVVVLCIVIVLVDVVIVAKLAAASGVSWLVQACNALRRHGLN